MIISFVPWVWGWNFVTFLRAIAEQDHGSGSPDFIRMAPTPNPGLTWILYAIEDREGGFVSPEEARNLLQEAASDEEPIHLPPSVLKELSVADIPEDVQLEVGTLKDGVIHIDWDGAIVNEGGAIKAYARNLHTRKYWYEPIGLENYLDLVRRAVEVRNSHRGDVALGDWDDDGAYINLSYSITVPETNLGRAYEHIRRVCAEIEEAANDATTKVGLLLSEVAQRVSGWGATPMDQLVNAVDKGKSADEKGRALEELMCKLLETIPGFKVAERVRTATEEIDILILNDSADPRLRRESAILLAECKNWTSKCGKDEVVIFREKIENRNRRCSLGFLISWNGFANTVTKELLRGSREGTLIILLEGKAIRTAVRNGSFIDVLLAAWNDAVTL